MIRSVKEEGHYTIKIKEKLPKKGNANWLFILKNTIVTKLEKWNVYKKEYDKIFIGVENLSNLKEYENDLDASNNGVEIGFGYVNKNTGAVHKRIN